MIPNVNKAKQYFFAAHGSQLYANEVPYSEHLEHVVEKLTKFGFDDPVMICAGYGHDSIEDTTTSYNDIVQRFGTEVAELVYAVTSELGRNRKERNAKTYPKIAGNLRATALKLADRIANVDYSLAKGGKDDMYRKEYPEFKRALFVHYLPNEVPETFETPDNCTAIYRMWAYLDRVIGS